MKDNYTHITIILDRTGSMDLIRDDTIGGFNTFLRAQKAEPSLATLTLVQFDSQDPYEIIHRFKPIAEVPELTRETFVPRANTPLLDAIGRGINDLEKSLADLTENERPSRVVMVIITDGQENSSQEFRKDHIEKMIKEKQEKSAWQFVFLSADLDAIGDALRSGMHASAVMAYDTNARAIGAAWRSLSRSVSDYRAARKEDVSFTEEDRDQQENEKKRK
ncbi:MAG TPA: hypothetical protein VK897_15775 [Anaerolineales bacterium]|nr:hypothetical protein [Anaerolineales bacterium]